MSPRVTAGGTTIHSHRGRARGHVLYGGGMPHILASRQVLRVAPAGGLGFRRLAGSRRQREINSVIIIGLGLSSSGSSDTNVSWKTFVLARVVQVVARLVRN